MKVHEAILKEINQREQEIDFLKQNRKIDNEQSQKVCTRCNTKNLHYYPMSNSWCCYITHKIKLLK